MDEETKGKEAPFQVQTIEGAFVAGYNSAYEAEASAIDRNDRAKAMGLKVRYSWK